MTKYALAFPGQGIVRGALLAPLKKYRSLYKPLLEEVDDALNERISAHLEAETGATEWLQRTSNAQPAILTTSYIIQHILKHEYGLELARNAQYLLGHSLGEYTALVVGGVFDLGSGAQIVRRRGLLMEEATAAASPSSMHALLFTKADKLASVRERAQEKGILANDNSRTQLVVSGEASVVDQFISSTNSKGKVIARATRLPVSVPFHNRILSKIEPELAEYIRTFKQSDPVVPVISNLTGSPVSDSTGAIANVISQTHSTVQWSQSVRFLEENDIHSMVCVGPGKVLEGLLRGTSVRGLAVDTPDTFEVAETVRL